MLPQLKRSAAGVSRRMTVVLCVAAAATLGAPLVSFSQRRAQPPQDPDAIVDESVMAVDDAQQPANRTSSPAAAKFAAPAAQPPETEYLPKLSASEKQLIKALDETTKVEFTETPLFEVADYLADFHGLVHRLLIDKRALDDSGISAETPITFRVKDVPLRSALKLMLPAHGLTYTIRDDVLLITTPDVADSTLITRVYPVGDFIRSANDYRSLINVIVAGIAPNSWDEMGGPASISALNNNKSLIIAQTREHHDEVLGLLRSMREARTMAGSSIIADPPERPRKQPPQGGMGGMGGQGMGGMGGMGGGMF